MKLEPGFYKIKLKNGAFGTCHYLRIFYKNGEHFYQLDHGIPERSKPITVNNIKTTVAFKDEDGDSFEFTARNLQSLKRIFSEFPRVAKQFGIERM